MSLKTQSGCRLCSFTFFLLLVLQSATAQTNWEPVNRWLSGNVKEMGGRAVLVIYQDGGIVYSKAVNQLGLMQKAIGKRLARKKGLDADEVLQDFDENTRQPIASCSKWLSAALVMTFVDAGELNINDSIGKYLPVMTENGKGAITIWQCLSHLTGILTPSLKDNLQERKRYQTMADEINAIAQMPMEGTPGKTFHYSNAGLQIAAAVIEKISGKDFTTLFKERISIPCEMMQTDFGDAPVPLAAGGAVSTATDYIHFLAMICNKGVYQQKRILSEASIAAMQLNRLASDAAIAYTPAEAGGWGYGFGEWVPTNITGITSGKTVCSPGLFGSFPWVNNELHYAGFLFTFGLKTKGRQDRYIQLMQLTNTTIGQPK